MVYNINFCYSCLSIFLKFVYQYLFDLRNCVNKLSLFVHKCISSNYSKKYY